MVEQVIGFETVLQADAFSNHEVLRDDGVHIVHAAGTDIRPAGRNVADVGGEVLIHAIRNGVVGGGFVVVDTLVPGA